MTPKEKAKDLLDTFEGILGHSLPTNEESYFKESKECAAACCDQLIAECIANDVHRNLIWCGDVSYANEDYWQAVKEEIRKL